MGTSRSSWARSLALRVKGASPELLEEIERDQRLTEALGSSDLPEVLEASGTHLGEAKEDMEAFREQYQSLERLRGRVPDWLRGADVSDFEDAAEAGDFPKLPRERLTELAWYMGELSDRLGTVEWWRGLEQEGRTLLGVEQADLKEQPQRRRSVRDEWRL